MQSKYATNSTMKHINFATGVFSTVRYALIFLLDSESVLFTFRLNEVPKIIVRLFNNLQNKINEISVVAL